MTTANEHSSSSQPTQTKIDWVDIIKRWRTSGLSQMAYCKANNILFNQFNYQHSKLSAQAKTKPKLLPVNIMPNTQAGVTPNNFILHYPNGMKLHIPVNAHPEAIKALLSCLETRQC